VSLNRYNPTRDANEPEIIAEYIRLNCSVDKVYNGPCDLIIGYVDPHLGAQTITVEVKLPAGPQGGTSHSKLTPGEMEYLGRHKGLHYVVRDLEDAQRSVGKLPSAIVSRGCR
jgi:hypothetical protein